MKLVDNQGNPISSSSMVLDVVPVESPEDSRIAPRQVGTGITRGQQIILSDNKGRLVHGNTPDVQNSFGQTLYDSTGVRRYMLANFPDGNVKAKLSQIGVDVNTATDDQLIWSSDFNNFKITTSGTVSITTVPSPFPAASEQTATVAHGLSAKPTVLAWADVPGTGGFSVDGKTIQVPASLAYTGGTGAVAILLYVTVDATNITFYVRNVSGVGISGLSPIWTFKYYVIRETAATS